ncbi:pyridoxal-phosphate dependent enzyme [Promicromonospora sp. Populi]|uniref:pyridoxal-phosphate dependent enzyme n=1 Tax=Promicromonospora sp. Populi TaxID=3239420 RepID=UPI0034E249A5
MTTIPGTLDTTSTIVVGDLLPGTRVVLRDETRYPSGSHKEPAAHAVIAAALAAGHDRVVVGSCGNYGKAMAAAAAAADLTCTVVLPLDWNDGGEFIEAAGADVRFVPGGYEDAVDAARLFAQETGAADGNVDGPYQEAVLDGHGSVVDSLHGALAGAHAALWLPIGNGTTAVALHRRLRELRWTVPLHGVGSPGNNPIVTSWPGAYRVLPSDGVVTTEHNEPLVNWHALHGPEALAAIADTGGAVHGAHDDQLVVARAALERYGVQASASGAAGLAGLLQHARSAPVSGDQVVLVTGR